MTVVPDSAELLSASGLIPPDSGRASYLVTALGRFRAAFWPAQNARARGTAVVLPGLLECLEKYYEVVSELRDRKFAVVTLDWPAQGLSDDFSFAERLTMAHYETVLRALIDELRRLEMPCPLVGFGHSMGGGILLAHLRDSPANFKAAVLCAPMIGISVHDRMPFLAPLSALLSALLGRHARKWPEPLNKRFTCDLGRHARTTDLFARHPALVARVPMIPWYRAAAELVGTFQTSGWHEKFSIPLLIGMASEETFVSNRCTADAARRIESCRTFLVPGAMHELLMETDEHRALFWEQADRFFDMHLI